MEVPNFDDKDLGIIAILILGLAAIVAGVIMSVSTATFISIVATPIASIGCLVTGRKNSKEDINTNGKV